PPPSEISVRAIRGPSCVSCARRAPPCGAGGSFTAAINRTRAANTAPSTTQTEFFHDGPVPLDVGLLQVVQKTAPLADHLVHAPARVVILLVHPQMLGQLVDARRQDRDLHLGRAGVAFVLLKLGDNLRLGFLGQRHVYTSVFQCSPCHHAAVGGLGRPSARFPCLVIPQAGRVAQPRRQRRRARKRTRTGPVPAGGAPPRSSSPRPGPAAMTATTGTPRASSSPRSSPCSPHSSARYSPAPGSSSSGAGSTRSAGSPSGDRSIPPGTPTTSYGRPRRRAAASTSPSASRRRMQLLETTRPSGARTVGATCTAAPRRPASSSSSRGVPAAPRPKRKSSPTTMRRAPRPSSSTSCTKASGDSDATSRSKRNTTTRATPSFRISRARCSTVDSAGGGPPPTTARGWGEKVSAT